MAEQIYVPIYQKNDNILLNPNRSIPENGIVFCFPTQSFYCHPAYILVNGVQMNSVINYQPTGLNQPDDLYYTTLTVQQINDLANAVSPVPPVSVNYGLFAQTANSTIITNTTVESSLINGGVGTLTVPANGFSIGDSFRAVFGGVINANNNQTIRIRVRAGSILLLDSGLQNLGSSVINDVWSLNIDFTIRQTGAAGVASIVSLGSFHYTKTNNASVQGFGFNVVNNTTFDTTISNILNVTAQWGAASTGNNMYSDIFVLNKVY